MSNSNSNNKYLNMKKAFSSFNSSTSITKDKNKKFNLNNESLIFNKLEKLNSNNIKSSKNIDFPVCISIFANNLSINENSINLNLNLKPKLNLKFANLDKKKFISRNSNIFLLSNSSKKYSNINESFSNFDKLSGKVDKNYQNKTKNNISFSFSRNSSVQNLFSKNKNNITSNTTFEKDLSNLSSSKTPLYISNKKKLTFSPLFIKE